MVLTFDLKDQLVESARYNKKDKLISKENNAYDDNGNRTSYTWVMGKHQVSHVEFEYDNKNLLVKQTYFKKNEDVRFAYVQEYSVF